MKMISTSIMAVLLSVFLVGCYSTACQQPTEAPAKMNMKGEG